MPKYMKDCKYISQEVNETPLFISVCHRFAYFSSHSKIVEKQPKIIPQKKAQKSYNTQKKASVIKKYLEA